MQASGLWSPAGKRRYGVLFQESASTTPMHFPAGTHVLYAMSNVPFSWNTGAAGLVQLKFNTSYWMVQGPDKDLLDAMWTPVPQFAAGPDEALLPAPSSASQYTGGPQADGEPEVQLRMPPVQR